MKEQDTVPLPLAQRSTDPNEVFRAAIGMLQSLIAQLEAAIETLDCDAVEFLAAEASRGWLTARIACRRLVRDAEIAREELETAYVALLDLFARASKAIDAPHMRDALRSLRGTLVVSKSGPLALVASSSAAAAGARFKQRK